MKCKPLAHKPGMLLLVSLIGIAAMLPGSGSAAEILSARGYFSQLLDGDVRLGTVGQRAGLHMTFKSPGDNRDAFSAAHADRPGEGGGGVHLSVRVPWR